jgi:hypothetical protein
MAGMAETSKCVFVAGNDDDDRMTELFEYNDAMIY